MKHIERRTEFSARFLAVATLGVILGLMYGCSLTPEANGFERIAVQAATLKVIDKSERKAEKAARIVEAVTLVRTLLDDTTTVAVLRDALLQRIAGRELPPAEHLLAVELTNALALELQQRIGEGVLSSASIVSVNTVLDWIESTASLYVPKSRVA